MICMALYFWSNNPFQALLSILHGSIDVLVHNFPYVAVEFSK